MPDDSFSRDILSQFCQRGIVDFRSPEGWHRPVTVAHDGTNIRRRQLAAANFRPDLGSGMRFMAIAADFAVDLGSILPLEAIPGNHRGGGDYVMGRSGCDCGSDDQRWHETRYHAATCFISHTLSRKDKFKPCTRALELE